MIVPKPIVGKIVRGDVRMVYRLAATRRPRIGERLYVKARQKDEVACHVIVENVENALLGDVTFEDARAAGWKTRDDFNLAWVAEHDKAWIERASEQAEAEAAELSMDADTFLTVLMLGRFDTRWAPKSVIAITFELDHAERPRLLAHRNARTNYVEHPAQAMPHEPEAVPANIQQQFSREEHQGWAARELKRESDRERLGLVERLQIALDEGGDPRVEESIRKRIRALETKNRRRA